MVWGGVTEWPQPCGPGFSGKALSSFQPLRACGWLTRLVSPGFTCGPMNAKPDTTCAGWEVGEQWPLTSQSGWASPQRPRLPLWPQTGSGPSEPSDHSRPSRQAGSEPGLLGQGWALGNGSQTAAQVPTSDSFIQVLLSSLREARAVLGPLSGHNTHGWKQAFLPSCPE